MFDEVYRLQELLACLRTFHSVLARWRRHSSAEERLLASSSLTVWRGLRRVAGILEAHPHARFHPRPIHRPGWVIHSRAAIIAALRRRTTARLGWLAHQLESLGKIAADISAVSRSPEVISACERIHVESRLVAQAAQHENREYAWSERVQKVRAGTPIHSRQGRSSILSSSESISAPSNGLTMDRTLTPI